MEKLLLSAKLAGGKYIIYPTNALAYDKSKSKNEAEIWYYETTKPVADFATAGVFGPYDSLAAAESAIVAVDPNCSRIYKPPTPPTTTSDF